MSAGEGFVAGQQMSALSDGSRGSLRNRALGFVYQFHHLLPEFTALENVMMTVLLGGASVPDAAARASELPESVGLRHRLGHKHGALHGGERPCPEPTRALDNNPAWLFGDRLTLNEYGRASGRERECKYRVISGCSRT